MNPTPTPLEEIVEQLITTLQYGIDHDDDGRVDEEVWRNQLRPALAAAYNAGLEKAREAVEKNAEISDAMLKPRVVSILNSLLLPTDKP